MLSGPNGDSGRARVKQFVERPEPVAHVRPLREQIVQNFRVRGGRRMQQHDGPRMDARQQLFIRLLRRGLRVAVPVDVGQAPDCLLYTSRCV